VKKFNKKRLLIVVSGITTVGAAAALLAGATFGFFSSAGDASGNNTFTGGNVLVGLDGSSSVTCAIGPMSPGDTQAKSGNVSCEYDVKYTGNVNAYMALDLAITGASGTAAVPYTQTTAPPVAQGLYDGTATGLQLTIGDGTTTYMAGTQYNTHVVTPTPATLTPTAGTASINDLLVNASPITTNATTHLTVTYTLPTTAGNAYNLARSTVVLRIHAVQADNNAIPADCSAGHVCAAAMTWS
jgi:hypothetical protein